MQIRRVQNGGKFVAKNRNFQWTNASIICWFRLIAGSNVALRKSANQSSTARGGSALNAIDGDRSVHHDVGGTGGRCSETNSEVSPWWMADLMKSYPVYAVRITSRSCCGNHGNRILFDLATKFIFKAFGVVYFYKFIVQLIDLDEIWLKSFVCNPIRSRV